MENWFRLRHLQSVYARNLNVCIKDLNCDSIFFALSTTDQENLGYFYQSTKCDNLLNPFWENVDLSFDSIKKFSFLDNFLITFFLSKKNKNKIFVEIKIHFSGLVALSKLITSGNNDDCQRFIFHLNNVPYSFKAECMIDEVKPTINVAEDVAVKIKKKLYNLETINKFLNLIADDHQQLVNQTLARRRIVENQIYQYRARMCKLGQKRNKIITITSLIESQRKNAKCKSAKLYSIREAVDTIKQKIIRTSENQEKTEADIAKQEGRIKQYREIYMKISNEYMIRMYQLIHELSRIFHINPTEWPTLSLSDNHEPKPTPIIIRSTDKLSICNLHLPNSDKQITISQDNSIFAALGMVCQLLSALSKIYDIPLRYPITLDDPKIAIRDCIIDDIDDSERSFLLVKSTAASFRLQYAIYLLNLNIVAIRGYFSLPTKSPDRTLWNLNTLIEGKNRAGDSGSTNDLVLSANASQTNLVNSTHLTKSQNLDSPDATRFSLMPSPLITNSYPAIN